MTRGLVASLMVLSAACSEGAATPAPQVPPTYGSASTPMPQGKAEARAKHRSPIGVARLTDLHALEAEMDRVNDENGPRAHVLAEMIPTTARAVVKLEAKGLSAPADLALRCDRLVGWRCVVGEESAHLGDDSAHVTELSHGSIALPKGESFRLLDADKAAAPGLLKVGVALPAKVQDNVDAVEPLRAAHGGFALEAPMGAQEVLVIALFEDARGFRKHVWVVKP